MPRTVEFESPVDTSTFSAIQLQPRIAATLTWSALARWLRVNLVSFPALVHEESTGLVVLGFHLELGEPVSFFDCDSIRVRAIFRALRCGARAQLDARFIAGQCPVASARLLMCPVRIDDPVALGATPAPLPARLLARLAPDEVESSGPGRVVPELRAGFETAGQPLAESAHDFIVYRSHCEVAEQWSWTEVPALLEDAREHMALSLKLPLARRLLGDKLHTLDIEFAQPFFSFEAGQVVSRSHLRDNQLGVVHRIISTHGAALHATAVETF